MSEKNFCLEKNCSWCCNPVKKQRKKGVETVFKIPKDKHGEDLWIKTGEEWAPLETIDTERVDIYECKKFNKETGLCEDYENRPDECKNTNCVNKNKELSPEEQRNQLIETKFIVTKKKV